MLEGGITLALKFGSAGRRAAPIVKLIVVKLLYKPKHGAT
jgi:hypothetical protein